MDINPYVILAVLVVLVVAILIPSLRILIRSARAARDDAAAPRPPSRAADYYTGTLRQAAEVVDGEANLATALNVAPEDLHRWLAGEEPPPIQVHLAALDLVTRGAPHARAE